MAPTYRPVSVSLNGLPPEVFGAPQTVDFIDARKNWESLESQELNNDRASRANNLDMALIQALKERYGGLDPSSFNPDEALQIAQRVAMQNGDLNTALSVERATRERANTSQPLTPSQREFFAAAGGMEIPEGTTRGDLNTMSALQRSQTYRDQTDLNIADPNRNLRAQKLVQELTGTKTKQISEDGAGEIGAFDDLTDFISNVKETYLPYISENRGERFLSATVNPNSAAARMMNELNLVATQLAAAYNGKRLSDLDYKVAKDIIQINDLDTMETIVNKMDRLSDFMAERKENKLSSLENANFNVSRFRGGASGAAPEQPTSSLPTNPDGSPLTREQFMAWRSKQQGQ